MMSNLVDFSTTPIIKVLVIEDDVVSGQPLVDALEKSNIRTAWATTATEGIQLKNQFLPDVVLLDLDLPDRNGIDVVNYLSQRRECGVIVVSGLTDEADRVVALELGADDYMAKPPVLRELVARIRAVNRRFTTRSANPPARAGSTTIQAGALTIDPTNQTVQGADGAPVGLTSAEFMTLKALIDAKGEVVSRNHISKVALNHPWYPEDRSVDQLIYNLRRKLIASGIETAIVSVRGYGYLVPQE